MLRTGSGAPGYDLHISPLEMLKVCKATSDVSVHSIATTAAVNSGVKRTNNAAITADSNEPCDINGASISRHGKQNLLKPPSESWYRKPLAKRLRDITCKAGYNLDHIKDCLNEAGNDLLSLLMFGELVGTEYSKTPVHNAAWRGTPEVLDLFVEAGKRLGVDFINVKATGEGNFGKTPIFYALTRSREEMVNHCLDLGADLLIVNNKGQTPCPLAASHLSEQLLH